MSTYNQVLSLAKNLSSDDQLRLLSELAMQLRDSMASDPDRSLADLIVSKLKADQPEEVAVIDCYAVNYGKWSLTLPARWNNHLVRTRPYLYTIPGKTAQRLGIEMEFPDARKQFGWHHLGLVGEGYIIQVIPFIGQIETRRIHSIRYYQNQTTSSVRLILDSLSDEEKNNYLE
ncbi:MAG: hypothetical protein AB4352_29315 [Hormoscilla sp.]